MTSEDRTWGHGAAPLDVTGQLGGRAVPNGPTSANIEETPGKAVVAVTERQLVDNDRRPRVATLLLGGDTHGECAFRDAPGPSPHSDV